MQHFDVRNRAEAVAREGKMNVTENQIISEEKVQIARGKQTLVEQDYNVAFVRARIAHLAYHQGGPVLDVGTGSCGCMAMTLTRRGLRVTAVDVAMGAVQNMKEQRGNFYKTIEVLQADAVRLPFPNGSYRIAVAFDMLCHASDPATILSELFRVSSGMVIISELNSAGCQFTHHQYNGFDTKLFDLLLEHCQDCQRFDDAHHTTYICENFDHRC